MQMKRKDNKTQLKGPLQTYEDFNTPKQFFICRSEPTSPGRKYVISYICDCDDLDFQDKNAILDGCSTVDSKLDYDGIEWYSMVLHGTRWYFAIE